MFPHFGHKWLCLHRGPFWQCDVDDDCGPDIPRTQQKQPETTKNLLVNTDIVNQKLEHSNSMIADALADVHIALDEFQHPPGSNSNQSHSDESQLTCDFINQKTVTNLCH